MRFGWAALGYLKNDINALPFIPMNGRMKNNKTE